MTAPAAEPSAVRMSVGELRRVLPDALRVMGIPLGQADSIAEMVLWTATTADGTFAFLRRRRAQLLWVPRPRAIVVADPRPRTRVVDARGASLLELGPAIFDYCCAEALNDGAVTVRVHRTYGDLFLPYLIWRSAAIGVDVTVAQATNDGTDGGASVRAEDALVVEAAPRPAGLDAPDWPEGYERGVEEGVVLVADDFRFLMEQFEMLRVPTSERSRSHAG